MTEPDYEDTEVELPITDERLVFEDVEPAAPEEIDEPPLEADDADLLEQHSPVPERPDDYH